ncbi:MAG: DNA-directed DNA polymerase II small subunit [Candidatus Thermoplasmatota archaeon]
MNEIIKSFSEHGTFVQPKTLDYILSKKNPEKFTSYITKRLKEYPLVLTIEHIKDLEEVKNEGNLTKRIVDTIDDKTEINTLQKKSEKESRKPKTESEKKEGINKGKTSFNQKVKRWKPKSKEYDSEIEIIKDVSGKSTCEGETRDFAKLFQNRYKTLRKIIQRQRREMANIIPIKRINRGTSQEVQIAGLVKEVRNTKNGHRLIGIEDDTGEAICICLKNDKEVFEISQNVVLDEVVGIKGKLSKKGDLILIKNIVFPDISIQNQTNASSVPVCAAFLSDIHIGSKKFLADEWKSFIKWINGKLGNSRQREVASRIKYLVLPGDLVDGIGIYPNQEKELSIKDIYKQYEELARQLECIPDHISLIMQPGNHDAVRPAEPQPTFDKEIQELFSGKDITFVGNPCNFSLHGVEILSYHGQSLLDFSTNIQKLKYNEPVKIMRQMLKKHHLAPIYGGHTPIAPEHHDYMVIENEPDIFVTGHVHLSTIDEYRGITLINASSWQDQTEYQKMKNFVPDPAKLPIADLKNNNVTMMDFNRKKT